MPRGAISSGSPPARAERIARGRRHDRRASGSSSSGGQSRQRRAGRIEGAAPADDAAPSSAAGSAAACQRTGRPCRRLIVETPRPDRAPPDADESRSAGHISGRKACEPHQRGFGIGFDRARHAEWRRGSCRMARRADVRATRPATAGVRSAPRGLITDLCRGEDEDETGETEGGDLRPLRSVTQRNHFAHTRRYIYATRTEIQMMTPARLRLTHQHTPTVNPSEALTLRSR